MISRTTRSLAATALASALLLTGCSSPEAGDSDDATASPTQSRTQGTAEATAESEETDRADEQGPQVQATTGAVVEGFPAVIQQLPDSEIVSSAVQPSEDGELVNANILMRTAENEEDALAFYSDTLGEADFEPVSDASSEGGVTTQTFHADDANQLVSVSIAPDPDDEEQMLVTVGGKVTP